MRLRAKQHLPTVLLTLLSIIQALALELLWSRLHELDHLWAGGWGAVVGWLQVAAICLGILQIWLFYTGLVMRFQWVPSLRDSVVPFAIGILEFTMVDLMGPSSLGLWFLVLAIIFALAVWESHMVSRRARSEPENRAFFDRLEPATLRDFVPNAAMVSGIALAGLALQVSGDQRWLAAVCLLLANGVMLFQVHVTHRFWEMTMAIDDPPADPP